MAAVTFGGVIVGALTAGIGLVPYMAVVGIAAVASGGAVAFRYRRPVDSRLILASENIIDVSLWKAAIDEEITRIEMQGKPMLPAGADPDIISHILGISAAGGLGGWTRVGMIDGIRVMEQTESLDDYKCRRAQVFVRCSPINTFVTLMDVGNLHWPRHGHLKVVHSIDDHVDILEINFVLPRGNKNKQESWIKSCKNKWEELKSYGMCPANTNLRSGRDIVEIDSEFVAVEGHLTRFWRLADDGSYIIIFTTTVVDESQLPLTVEPTHNKDKVRRKDSFRLQYHLTANICTVYFSHRYLQFHKESLLFLYLKSQRF